MERFNIFLEFKVKADLHYAAPWHFLSNTEEQGHCFLIHLNPWHFCVTLSNIHALLFPLYPMKQLSSVQFSRSVVSDLLQPHESQHARPSCPSPTPRLHSDSHPSSQWCHPAISSSVVPFSFWPKPSQHQSLFNESDFAWSGQNTGISASALFPPEKSQSWSPSEWTGWISLQSKGLSRAFSNTTVQKHQFFSTQLSSQSNSHIHTWPQEKP